LPTERATPGHESARIGSVRAEECSAAVVCAPSSRMTQRRSRRSGALAAGSATRSADSLRRRPAGGRGRRDGRRHLRWTRGALAKFHRILHRDDRCRDANVPSVWKCLPRVGPQPWSIPSCIRRRCSGRDRDGSLRPVSCREDDWVAEGRDLGDEHVLAQDGLSASDTHGRNAVRHQPGHAGNARRVFKL
jgi:hypothetical protein